MESFDPMNPAPDGHISVARSQRPVITSCVSLAVASVVLAARFYTRSRLQRSLGSEDWTILVSFVGCSASNALPIHSRQTR